MSTKQRAASEPSAMLRGPFGPILMAPLSEWRPVGCKGNCLYPLTGDLKHLNIFFSNAVFYKKRR